MNLELDEYAYLNSPIHRWAPPCKLIGLMSLIIAFALVEDLRLIPLMLGITGLLYILARLPLSFWINRVKYPGWFLLAVVALLPWSSGQTVIWQWGLLTLRQEGLASTLLVASRFLSIITLGLVLFGTMPFLTTVKTMRSLGVPPILADMLLLSYRYLFEIAANLAQMQRAMRLRGFRTQGHDTRSRSRLWGIPDWQFFSRLASLMGTLFIRSYEQSEQIYKAMQLRGYGRHQARMPAPRERTLAGTQMQSSLLPPPSRSQSPTFRFYLAHLPQLRPGVIYSWSNAGLMVSVLSALGIVVLEILV